jgi:hypothetical protein
MPLLVYGGLRSTISGNCIAVVSNGQAVIGILAKWLTQSTVGPAAWRCLFHC